MPLGPLPGEKRNRKRSPQYCINLGETPEAKAVKEKYDSFAKRFGFKDKRNTNRNKDFMSELLENYEYRHIEEPRGFIEPAKAAKCEPGESKSAYIFKGEELLYQSTYCAVTCTETVGQVPGPVVLPDGKVNYNQLRRDSTNFINTDDGSTSDSQMVVDHRGAAEELTGALSSEQTTTCSIPQSDHGHLSSPYYKLKPFVVNEPPKDSAQESDSTEDQETGHCYGTSQLVVQEGVGGWEANSAPLLALRSDLRQTTFSNQNLPLPSNLTDTVVLPDNGFSSCLSVIDSSNVPLQFSDRIFPAVCVTSEAGAVEQTVDGDILADALQAASRVDIYRNNEELIEQLSGQDLLPLSNTLGTAEISGGAAAASDSEAVIAQTDHLLKSLLGPYTSVPADGENLPPDVSNSGAQACAPQLSQKSKCPESSEETQREFENCLQKLIEINGSGTESFQMDAMLDHEGALSEADGGTGPSEEPETVVGQTDRS